jgi:hypothetical protein
VLFRTSDSSSSIRSFNCCNSVMSPGSCVFDSRDLPGLDHTGAADVRAARLPEAEVAVSCMTPNGLIIGGEVAVHSCGCWF